MTAFEQHPSGDPAYELPQDCAMALLACELAGCSGRVWIDVENMEMWVTDGPGLILFRSTLQVPTE